VIPDQSNVANCLTCHKMWCIAVPSPVLRANAKAILLGARVEFDVTARAQKSRG